MLTRKVCLDCFKARAKIKPIDVEDNVQALLDPKSIPTLEQRFDTEWNEFRCPCNLSKYLKTSDYPPEKCEYVLEHTVNQRSKLYHEWLWIKEAWYHAPMVVATISMFFVVNLSIIALFIYGVIMSILQKFQII